VQIRNVKTLLTYRLPRDIPELENEERLELNLYCGIQTFNSSYSSDPTDSRHVSEQDLWSWFVAASQGRGLGLDLGRGLAAVTPNRHGEREHCPLPDQSLESRKDAGEFPT
jgi:hypothetical protein